MNKKDFIAIKAEVESPTYAKYLLELASDGILAAENYLLLKAIEYERQG